MAPSVSAPAALPALSFFGDASSRDSDFMVAGGLAVAGNRISEIEDQIAALREDAGIRSEFPGVNIAAALKRRRTRPSFAMVLI